MREILDGVDDVHFSELTSSDVVRHRLVAEIVEAYERWDETRSPVVRERAERNAQRSRTR